MSRNCQLWIQRVVALDALVIVWGLSAYIGNFTAAVILTPLLGWLILTREIEGPQKEQEDEYEDPGYLPASVDEYIHDVLRANPGIDRAALKALVAEYYPDVPEAIVDWGVL